MRDLAAQAPAWRDRYVDFLRGASILVVVVGHWMSAIITLDGGRIILRGAIGVTSGLWILTWILQVMPVFFFVGGFSNAVGLRSRIGDPVAVAAFRRARIARLFRPTLVFAAAWFLVELVMHALDVGGQGMLRGFRAGNIPFGPLWFLGVYLVVTLASPEMFRWHVRAGRTVLFALAAGAIVVDVAAFGFGLIELRWLNLALVWLLVHQLGFFYADGSLLRLDRRQAALLALAGLAALILLTNLGVYPRSMIGTDAEFFGLKPIERISNMGPPTLCILALTTWQLGLILLARPAVTRWLERPRAWQATIAVNVAIMTIYLWHMTAYAIVIAVFRPLGLGVPLDSTPRWWLERPFWIVVPGVVLLALVALFARFENPRDATARARPV